MIARVFAVLLLGFLAGCGKPSANPSSTAGGPVPREVSPAAAPQAATSVVPEAVIVPAAGGNQLASTLSELTQAVRKYAAEQRRVPKTFEELVTKGYLTGMPEAPAGKRFAIDRNLQVYLANP